LTSIRRSALGFAVVGVLSTLTHVCVATLCIELLGARPPVANVVAFAVATLFSYTANTLLSFGQQLNLATAWRFGLVASAGGVVSTLMTWLVERAGGHYALGIALVVTVIPAFSYMGHRFFTYRLR
jgi:putative flippase GtrA